MLVLHLLPNLEYAAAGRQISLLAPSLRKTVDIHVAALGREGPIAEPLRAAGVPIHVLGSGRRLGFAAIWTLRRLIRDLRPAIVHSWRLPALRAAGLLRATRIPPVRLVAAEIFHGQRTMLLDRCLVRCADAVIATHPAEKSALRRLGAEPKRIHELPPMVMGPAAAPPALGLPLPPDAKIVICIGNLSPQHGFRDAIWAADILRYPIPDLHLVIIGDGPDRRRLANFARGINPAGGHVHFLPARPDAADMLAHASVVWVPSRSNCGRQVLLEAMAAGRPVIASGLRSLAAIAADGRTAHLAPPGDPIALARQTRALLEDPDLAEKLGSAGRAAVASFSPEASASAYAALYAALK